MRTLATLAILHLSLVAGAASQEVVSAFHGYPWGTPVEAIPEVADSRQVGERDGLAIYSAQAEVMGKQALVGFYFHPETGGLVEGAYVWALTLQDCHGMWATVVERVESEYPGLEREARIPGRDASERQVYDTDCEFFVFNAHRETWNVVYRNPGPPDDRVSLRMRAIERVPRLTVTYRGGAGQAWMDQRPGSG